MTEDYWPKTSWKDYAAGVAIYVTYVTTIILLFELL